MLRALYDRELEKRGLPPRDGVEAAPPAKEVADDAKAKHLDDSDIPKAPVADQEGEGEEEDEPWAHDVEVDPEDLVAPKGSQDVD